MHLFRDMKDEGIIFIIARGAKIKKLMQIERNVMQLSKSL